MKGSFNIIVIGVLLTVSAYFHNAFSEVVSKFDSDAEFIKCVLRPGQKRLSVLPGNGWDNIVNEERGPTTNRENYALCRSSPDDRYVIPDEVIIEPLKSSHIELSSQAFSHFTNYTSLTALSVNIGGDVGFFQVSIGGDFSFEKEMIRRAENTNKGLTMRSQLRHRWFAVHQLPDSQLHPRFRNRLLDIAAHLERSNMSGSNADLTMNIVSEKGRIMSNFGKEEMFNMMESLRASYLADLIVRDFGTHSITAVEAGGVVAKIDSLVASTRTMYDSDKTKLEYGARVSFFDFFKINNSAKFGQGKDYTDEYDSTVASSFILSYGGPSLKASDMNLTIWESGVGDNLVAIDRRGRPIYDLITPRALPELSESLTFALAATVKSAVMRYYEANSIVGCLNPFSSAYDSDANIASDRCDDMDFQDPTANSESGQTPFGGLYTTCEGPDDLCSRYRSPNLATGKTSCPEGYKAINLLPPQVRSCAMKCDTAGIFHKPVCVHECAVTQAYWCAIDTNYTSVSPQQPNTNMELGFLFGGIYTDTSVNPITNAQSCPLYYVNQLIGRRIQVCVSTDREFGRRYSMAFGGFYACQSGNPLYDVLSLNKSSQNIRRWVKRGRGNGLEEGLLEDGYALIWPKQCPNGYTSHAAGIEDTCLVNYCVPGNSLKVVKDRRLKRPPFIQLPEFSKYDLKSDVQKALNEPLHLVDTFTGRSYYNEDGNWVEDTEDSSIMDTKAMTVFAVFGIIFVICVGVLLIIGAALLIVKIRNICRKNTP